MQNYKLCLLDFDGTLFDTLESLYPVFINSFKEVGIKIEEKDCLQLTRIRLSEGFYRFGGTQDKIEKYYGAIEKYLNSYETVEATKIYKDTISFINKAKELGMTLGIVTSNNTLHVKEVLNKFNISSDAFSIYVGNKETKKHKPFPDPILKALEMYNKPIKLDEAVYIGDALADVECAKNAGIIPILLDRYNEYINSDVIIIKSLDDFFNI